MEPDVDSRLARARSREVASENPVSFRKPRKPPLMSHREASVDTKSQRTNVASTMREDLNSEQIQRYLACEPTDLTR